MKFLIIGPTLTEEMEMHLPGASPAAGKFLRNLANGLREMGYITSSIAYVTVADIDKQGYSYEMKQGDSYFVFKDRFVVPSLLQFNRLSSEILDNDTFVIFYNIPYSSWWLASRLLRKDKKCLLLLADYTDPSEQSSILRKVFSYIEGKMISSYDKYILLSSEAEKKLKICSSKLIIEGGIDIESFNGISEPQKVKGKKLRFLYSGALSEVAGVDLLLDAIKINNNTEIEFVVSGKGPLSDKVLEFAKHDQRVKYVGYVSNEEYYKYLNSSHVMINPRNMNMNQNRNNFPSKVLEYLASGRVVISTKFSGFERFDDYFNWYDGSVNALNEMINNTFILYDSICKDTYKINRNAASNFSWPSQAEKIIKYIEGNNGK